MSSLTEPRRRLSLVDCTSIIVGIIIGSGIYESTSRVAAQADSVSTLVALWLAGGVFSLVGAWCYAELATRFPEDGGDYVYLSRAFGRPIGFLFAWTQLWVIRPGSIGAMACIFAAYAAPLLPLGSHSFLIYACGSIVALSLVNMSGVPQGTRTQNLLTGAKILGLSAVAAAAFFGPASVPNPFVDRTRGDLAFAMIFVLFAFSGWNEIGCVTAEVREPRRNVMRALVLAAATVTIIYLGVNLACVRVLGLTGMQHSRAVMTDAVASAVGDGASRALGALICISALGSTNGMIFTGARIYYAFGRQHPMFSALARWNPRFGTPLISLTVQCLVTAGLVVGFSGSGDGGRYDFDRLVMFMTPPFYGFLAASAAAVVLFRLRKLGETDAFCSPLFPSAPLLMAAGSAFMAWKGIEYIRSQWGAAAGWPIAWVIGTAITGVALAAIDAIQRRRSKAAT